MTFTSVKTRNVNLRFFHQPICLQLDTRYYLSIIFSTKEPVTLIALSHDLTGLFWLQVLIAMCTYWLYPYLHLSTGEKLRKKTLVIVTIHYSQKNFKDIKPTHSLNRSKYTEILIGRRWFLKCLCIAWDLWKIKKQRTKIFRWAGTLSILKGPYRFWAQ